MITLRDAIAQSIAEAVDAHVGATGDNPTLDEIGEAIVWGGIDVIVSMGGEVKPIVLVGKRWAARGSRRRGA